MQTNLSDLLANIGNESHESHSPAEWSTIYQDMKRNQSDYTLKKVRERKERLELGKCDIPRTGRVMAFIDNDWLDLQTTKFKAKYPELKSKKPTAIIERVKSLRYNDNKIEMTIERYLIRHK